MPKPSQANTMYIEWVSMAFLMLPDAELVLTLMGLLKDQGRDGYGGTISSSRSLKRGLNGCTGGGGLEGLSSTCELGVVGEEGIVSSIRLWFPWQMCRVMDVVVVNVHVHCWLEQHSHGKWGGLCWLQRWRLLDCHMSSWWSVRSWDSENLRNCLLHPLAYSLHSGTHHLLYIPQLCLLHVVQELRQLQDLLWKNLLYPSQQAGSAVQMYNSRNFQRNQLKLTLIRRSGGDIQRKRRKQLT